VLGLIDRTAIIERGIEGTIVYLIKVSFLEKNEERGLEPDAGVSDAKLSLLLRNTFCYDIP
jgi:hypothetical protein